MYFFLVLHQLFGRTNGASSVEETEISLFISANCKESKRINITEGISARKQEGDSLSPLYLIIFVSRNKSEPGFQPPTLSFWVFFLIIS